MQERSYSGVAGAELSGAPGRGLVNDEAEFFKVDGLEPPTLFSPRNALNAFDGVKTWATTSSSSSSSVLVTGSARRRRAATALTGLAVAGTG